MKPFGEQGVVLKEERLLSLEVSKFMHCNFGVYVLYAAKIG